MSSLYVSPMVEIIIEMSFRPFNVPEIDIVKRLLENGMVPIIN